MELEKEIEPSRSSNEEAVTSKVSASHKKEA
jgi:hypothetical protein